MGDEVTERYVPVRLPSGASGVFALACQECSVLVLDADGHDRFHALVLAPRLLNRPADG